MSRLAITALVALLPSLLLAQDRSPRPLRIEVPEAGGNGHAETWDGRVFVLTRGSAAGPVWGAQVLRPQRIALDGEGRPSFPSGSFSPYTEFETPASSAAAGLTELNALALVPAPGLAENPYRSDAAGNPSVMGPCETYDAILVTQRYKPGDDQLGRMRYRFVVGSPRTRNAAILRVQRVEGFQPFAQQNGQPLRGIEPTLTFDGRLLIWQGHPSNNSAYDVISYSVNQTSSARRGWTAPKSLSAMHNDRALNVAGLRFDERYPLAQEPLRSSDGQTYTGLVHGAYPWISRDGSELFLTTTVTEDRARRGTLSVLGRLTGWALRPLDGPINPDRNRTLRLFTSSPGLTPGMWTPFRDSAKKIPALGGGRPVYPLFSSNTAEYADIDLSDAGDGEHLVVLRMNEVVTKEGTFDPTRTPETSGRGLAGRLEGGAAFPQELGLEDKTVGHVGQAIFFPQRGAVRVRPGQQAREGLTVSLWIRRLASLAGDAQNRYLFAAHQPGSWNLILEESGRIQATVNAGQQARRSGPVGPSLALDRWTHVAFTYSASEGRLRVYHDGALTSERVFGPGLISPSSSDLIVGPGGQRPLAPQVAEGAPVLLLDELFVSRVDRSPSEVAAAAFRSTQSSLGQSSQTKTNVGAPLPQGIESQDLQLPATTVTSDAAAELGELLFFDPRLSRDAKVSCASCHKPELAFSDGLAKAQGVEGRVGERNTPTILNRALGKAQLWDGRAANLPEQALLPIAHANEMDLPLSEALARLKTSPTYTSLFLRAFGKAPDAAGLGQALAAFELRQLSGGSRVDRYESGERSALSPSEVRGRQLFHGKARCVACHSGPNYSDEGFHDTASTDDTSDGGLGAVNGRASDLGRFKTPTLREVSRTAPYLHDGSVSTLEALVDLYDRGGLRRQGRDRELRALGLSSVEKADLAQFLRALEGASSAPSAPTLPSDLVVEGLSDAPDEAPTVTQPTVTQPTVTQPTVTQPTGATGQAITNEPTSVALTEPGPTLPAPTSSEPETSPQPAPHGAWIQRLYQVFLGRQASPAETQARESELAAGVHPVDLTQALASSQEARDRVLEGLYQRYLGRAIDPSGRAHYRRALAEGRSRSQIESDLLASGEYAARTGNTAQGWLRGLYRDVHLRAPDTGGFNHFQQTLRIPGSKVAVTFAFLHAPERRARWVRACYAEILARTPSADELQRWLQALAAGASLDEVRTDLAASLAP